MEDGLPSVILVNALLPPREENDLVRQLRCLPQQAAPEILITPVFSESSGRTVSSPALDGSGVELDGPNPRDVRA